MPSRSSNHGNEWRMTFVQRNKLKLVWIEGMEEELRHTVSGRRGRGKRAIHHMRCRKRRRAPCTFNADKMRSVVECEPLNSMEYDTPCLDAARACEEDFKWKDRVCAGLTLKSACATDLPGSNSKSPFHGYEYASNSGATKRRAYLIVEFFSSSLPRLHEFLGPNNGQSQAILGSLQLEICINKVDCIVVRAWTRLPVPRTEPSSPRTSPRKLHQIDMLFSRAVFAVLAFTGLSAVASPTPVIEKRQDVSEVLGVIETLSTAVDAILPQIDSLVTEGTATEETITPLLQGVVDALNTANTSLQGLTPIESPTEEVETQVATAISDVYTRIVTTVDKLATAQPALAALFPGIGLDLALQQVLLGLQIVLSGVLRLVANLLRALGGVLSGLGFTLTTALLGLRASASASFWECGKRGSTVNDVPPHTYPKDARLTGRRVRRWLPPAPHPDELTQNSPLFCSLVRDPAQPSASLPSLDHVLLSCCLRCLTFGGLSAIAAPTPVEVEVEVKGREVVSEVLGVVGTLGTTVDAILPQIDSLVSGAVVTVDNVTPLVLDLVNAVNTATASLQVLTPVEKVTDEVKEEVGQAVAEIYAKIGKTVQTVQALGGEVAQVIETTGLTVALQGLLAGLQQLLKGVVKVVSNLLATLGLGPVLSALGLNQLLGGLFSGLGLL
ncbi:hypothetical protein NMY22_g10911 [Coprinellus aureogranulatus]|nr:hypothetical protein NMY22_g10911 [Coprinellus aureogranulatus]